MAMVFGLGLTTQAKADIPAWACNMTFKGKATGVAANIALFTNNPKDLLGNYLVAQGQAAVVGGVGVLAAAHTDIPAITLNLSLQFTIGFGIKLGFDKLKIEFDQDHM